MKIIFSNQCSCGKSPNSLYFNEQRTAIDVWLGFNHLETHNMSDAFSDPVYFSVHYNGKHILNITE